MGVSTMGIMDCGHHRLSKKLGMSKYCRAWVQERCNEQVNHRWKAADKRT